LQQLKGKEFPTEDGSHKSSSIISPFSRPSKSLCCKYCGASHSPKDCTRKLKRSRLSTLSSPPKIVSNLKLSTAASSKVKRTGFFLNCSLFFVLCSFQPTKNK